jgi:hypothetical protein
MQGVVGQRELLLWLLPLRGHTQEAQEVAAAVLGTTCSMSAHRVRLAATGSVEHTVVNRTGRGQAGVCWCAGGGGVFDATEGL